MSFVRHSFNVDGDFELVSFIIYLRIGFSDPRSLSALPYRTPLEDLGDDPTLGLARDSSTPPNLSHAFSGQRRHKSQGFIPNDSSWKEICMESAVMTADIHIAVHGSKLRRKSRGVPYTYQAFATEHSRRGGTLSELRGASYRFVTLSQCSHTSMCTIYCSLNVP